MENNGIPAIDKCRKISVRTKMILILSAALFIFGFSAAAISYNTYMASSIEQHERLATGITNLIADEINPSRIDEYLKNGRTVEDYNETERRLYNIIKSSPDIKFLYVYKIMADGRHIIFDLDKEETSEPTKIGSVEAFEEEFREYIPQLVQGQKIDPIISDGTYGWLLSVYKPVYDSDGVCKCYVGVDISMDDLKKQAQDYIIKIAAIFLGVFILILLAGFQLAKYNLILPINKMAHFAGIFAYNNEKEIEKNLENIKNLKINTGDEIENLYNAFVKMTEDSLEYTKALKAKMILYRKCRPLLL